MTGVEAAPVSVGRSAGDTAVRARPWTRWFYLAMALVLSALVIRGFWPSYFGPLVSGQPLSRPWIVHVHAAVFGGWMVLLFAQAWLAAARRVRWHRRVGRLGIAYGAVVLLIGLAVSFVAPVLHVRNGSWTLDEAAGFLLLPLVDMVLFAGFFGAAIVYRRRPEAHKRLILAASVALAFPAVARMFDSPVAVLLLWLSPLAAAVAFDVRIRRRVHPVHVISVGVLTAAFGRVFLLESDAWVAIGRGLLRPWL